MAVRSSHAVVTHYYLGQLGSFSIANSGRGCVDPYFFCSDAAQQPSLDSTRIAESQGSLSQVEMTGAYLNPNPLVLNQLFISPGSQYSKYQEKGWPKEAVPCHSSRLYNNE